MSKHNQHNMKDNKLQQHDQQQQQQQQPHQQVSRSSSMLSEKLRTIFRLGQSKSGPPAGSSNSIGIGQSGQNSHLQLHSRHTSEYTLSHNQKNSVTHFNEMKARLKALKELELVVENKRLVDNTCEYLIWETIDMLDNDKPTEVRHAIWRFYKCLVHGQCEKLHTLRYKFLLLIKEHTIHDEDIPARLELLVALTENGKNVEYCQKEIGPFMASWFDKIMAAGKMAEFLSLLINLIKFNATQISCDPDVITNIIKKTCHLTMKVKGQTRVDELPYCFNLLDVILCYSMIPSESLGLFAIVLCKGVNMKCVCEICCRVMKNLLSSKLGHSCVNILCNLLKDEGHHQDISLLRGAVYFISSCLWGATRIVSLKHSSSSILPAFIKALECGNIFVGLEVALAVRNLTEKQGKDMTIMTWALVMDICMTFATSYDISISDSPNSEFPKEVHKLLDSIEELHQHGLFYGDKDRLFQILEKCSPHRPESSVIRMINYRSEMIKDNKCNWIEPLRQLIENYYKNEKRSEIRMKALDALCDVLTVHSPNEELIDLIILPYFRSIDCDSNNKCREKVIEILINIEDNCLVAKRCNDIIDILQKVCYRSLDTRLTTTDPTYDVRSAVTGLITIFERKLYKLPFLPAIHAFKILTSYFNMLYNMPSDHHVAFAAVKQDVFKCTLNLRANSVGQIATLSRRKGLSSRNASSSSSSSSSSPTSESLIYSPFIRRLKAEMTCFTPSESLLSQQFIQLTPSLPQSTLSPPPSPQIATPSTSPFTIPFNEIFLPLMTCIKTERDWSVLKFVLTELPVFLKNKALILFVNPMIANDLSSALNELVERSKNINDFIFAPDNKLSKTDVQFSIFPALASLISYQEVLDLKQKHNLIRGLQNGLVVVSSKFSIRQCIISLTICAMEMQEVMSKCLPEVLLKISKISATVTLSIPKLEFLSNLILLPELYKCFTMEQYMSVFAIALPYTNPNLFTEYTVTMAHRVIALWFMKCRPRYRPPIVNYIIKGLQNNAMQELSPNTPQSANSDAQRNRSSSLNAEIANQHRKLESRLPSSTPHSPPPNPLPLTPSSNFSFSFSNEQVQQQLLLENVNQESRLEMVEACMDLLSASTYGTCSNVSAKFPIFERILDRSRSETWLIGHKMITITTSGCDTRVMSNGLCLKCKCNCKYGDQDGNTGITPLVINNNMSMTSNNNMENTGIPEKVNENDNLLSRRRHQSELHRVRPASTKPTSNAFDDSFINSSSNSDSNIQSPIASSTANLNCNSLCCCWCQGWAEIVVRRPTGNTSWITRLENTLGMTPYSTSPPDELPDLSDFFIGASSLNSNSSDETIIGCSKEESPEYMNVHPLHSSQSHLQQPIAIPAGPQGPISATVRAKPDHIGFEQNRFIPIGNESKLADAERAASTPPAFKRASSSPDMEGDQYLIKNCEKLTVNNHSNSNHSNTGYYNAISEPTTTSTTPTILNNNQQPTLSASSISRAASFGSRKSPLKVRPDIKAKSAEKRLQLNFKETGESTARGVNFAVGGQSSSSTSLFEGRVVNTVNAVNTHEHLHHHDETSNGTTVGQSVTGGHRERASTITQMSPAVDISRLRNSKSNEIPSHHQKASGLNPKSVFLHLYYNSCFDERTSEKRDKEMREKRIPILLPKTEAIERGMRNLDFITPYETHKIGVIYVGEDQTNEKAAILANQFGSQRYIEFLRGLGSFIKLEDVDTKTCYVGGLDTSGSAFDGKFAISWQDQITQVIFHVATLMPNKPNDPLCNDKNLHIGNDYVCIVYNNSGETFSLSTIKGDGQFIQAIIVVTPYEYNTNLVTVQVKDEAIDLIGHFEPQMLSDTSLPIYVRQLALHANLCFNRKAPTSSHHVSNWVQRLKQIKRIKERVTNVSGNSGGRMIAASGDTLITHVSEVVNNGHNQMIITGDNKSQYIFPDFTDYA